MTGNAPGSGRILGSLRSADGKGVVRIEDRYDTGINDLWVAITDPGHLARWYGEVEGELRLGGEYLRRVFASGSEGAGRIDACEPPRRLLVKQSPRQPDEHVIEATLTADGDQTILVVEARGIPLDKLFAYAAGVQIHVEDLTDYVAGRERRDAEARWDELEPAYQALADNVR